MTNIIEYPEWKNAVNEIVTRVEAEGYGILITHEQLLGYFKMLEPNNMKELKKYQFKLLSYTENLKESLLEDHNIFLMSVRGKGYQVLKPDDQVVIGPDHFIKKSRRYINKAISTLANVNERLLSMEKAEVRLLKMQRVAFIKSSMNKRKLPEIKEKKKLLN